MIYYVTSGTLNYTHSSLADPGKPAKMANKTVVLCVVEFLLHCFVLMCVILD